MHSPIHRIRLVQPKQQLIINNFSDNESDGLSSPSSYASSSSEHAQIVPIQHWHNIPVIKTEETEERKSILLTSDYESDTGDESDLDAYSDEYSDDFESYDSSAVTSNSPIHINNDDVFAHNRIMTKSEAEQIICRNVCGWIEKMRLLKLLREQKILKQKEQKLLEMLYSYSEKERQRIY